MPGYNAAAEAAAPAILVRPEEAAEMLRISRTAVFGLLARGELASITIGHRRRIPRAALEDYVTRRLASAGGGDTEGQHPAGQDSEAR